MKKVLVVHRKRIGFEHARARWGDYDVHFADFCLHDLFAVIQQGHIQKLRERGKLEEAIRSIAEWEPDVVFCGCPEAFLIQFVLRARGMRVPPFVIVDLAHFRKAQAVCAWIESKYQTNPFQEILSCPTNYWLCYTRSEMEEHIALGVNRERIFYVPCSLYFQDETFLAEKGRARIIREKGVPPSLELVVRPFRDEIVACGNNSRDYPTLLLAARGLPCRVQIISSDFYKRQMPLPPNVVVHDYLPLHQLYAVLSAVRFIVVPLRSSILSPGTATSALAIGFGKPVIASDFPCLYDYVKDAKTGLLVKPADPVALRQAIKTLNEDEDLRRKMSEQARILSDRLDDVARVNLTRVFELATASKVPV